MDEIYQNYHKHSMYTNPIMPDSCTYPKEYAERAKLLGHTIISSCEHGYGGRAIEYYDLAEEYDLKFLYSAELYFVYDRTEKDNTNAHIWIGAKNESGRKQLNRIITAANLEGYYYRARIDYDLLMSLNPNDVWITTACLGGIWKYNKDNTKSTKLIDEWSTTSYEEPFDMLIDNIHKKFEDHFFLEVQANNTKEQKELNQIILDRSAHYDIKIIAGTDSHYILPGDAWKRDYLQKSSGIFFEEEEGWYMDYPQGSVLVKRFQEQEVLSDDKIEEALESTNIFLEVEKYTSEIFDYEMKMPSAPKYENMTDEEKKQALIKIVKEGWQDAKKDVPEEMHQHYLVEIAKELDIIFKIKHADYFLLNYEIIKEATQNRGGMITFSGRGSAPSFFVNHLLGFTQIDRISSPITLYPERFLSTSRMSAGSLADIDFNCGNTPVFEQTQTDIMGEGHSYPMIAYGTQKPKAAWKMYCRAVDVPFELSNEISAQIDEYDKALKYWDEESGEDEPDVNDYIPNELKEAFSKSKDFLGIISQASRHPCGNVLFSKDIREEFSLLRLKSKSGKETIVANCDGKWIEKHLMLKNDLLTVACVKLNYLLYERVNIPYMSLNQLLSECKKHEEVWKIYENGYVIGLNQVEKNSTKRKVMQYKPKNISELSALIAGIRPAFKSLIDKLINREHFEYGIPTLDKLLQTEELPESFILYQEQIMRVLSYAGIPMGDCYTVIKSISKKRFEKIMYYKEQFLKGMASKLIEEEHITEDRANEVSNIIWGVVEDASAYGFNSSHSLSVSFDSLLAAYFKALYPIEFYEVYLNLQMERADKAKALLATKEMKKAFDISLLPMRFGQNNTKYTAYKDQNALSNCLKSIKGFGDIVGEELFRLAQHKDEFDSFIDILVARDDYFKLYPLEVWDKYCSENEVDEEKKNKIRQILEQTDFSQIKINKIQKIFENLPEEEAEDLFTILSDSKPLWKIRVNETQMKILIKLDYFIEYGKNQKLLKEFDIFSLCYGKTQIKKNEQSYDMNIIQQCLIKETESLYKVNFTEYIKLISEKIEDKAIVLIDQMRFERELLEIPIYQNKNIPEEVKYVLAFKTYGDKINTPYLLLYTLSTGEIIKCQVNKSKVFRERPFGIGSVLETKCIQDIPKKKQTDDGKWIVTDQLKTVLTSYDVLVRDEILEKETENANAE